MPRPRKNHLASFSPTLAKRLWSRIDRLGPDECWPWTGYADRHGYGRISVGLDVNGRAVQVPASRAAWMLVNDRFLPSDVLIRHSCDNPPCCNPAHLEVGTHADNNRDMVERGRAIYVQGERIAQAKLTEDEVREIVTMRGEGRTLKEIAAHFGVHFGTVQLILLGKTWTHVTGLPRIERLSAVPHKKRDRRGARNNGSKLTEEEVRAIHVMRREGKTQREIAEHFPVGSTTINRILSGKRWGHIME